MVIIKIIFYLYIFIITLTTANALSSWLMIREKFKELEKISEKYKDKEFSGVIVNELEVKLLLLMEKKLRFIYLAKMFMLSFGIYLLVLISLYQWGEKTQIIFKSAAVSCWVTQIIIITKDYFKRRRG